MLEFLQFLRSFVQYILNCIYSSYLVKLRKYYELLALQICRNPRNFIIWPAAITFILSYPAIYSLYTNPTWFESRYLMGVQDIGIGIQSALNSDSADAFGWNSTGLDRLAVKQIWLTNLDSDANGQSVTSERLNPGVLNKKFFIDSFHLQEEILEGLNFDSKSPDSNWNFAYLHSPLQFWDNDLKAIEDDKNVIKTLNKNAINSKNLKLAHSSLFSGIIKVNGLIKSADALRIVIFYKPSENGEDAGKIWDANLENLITNSNASLSNFKVLEGWNKNETKTFLLKLTKMTNTDHFILSISYVLIALYFIISISSLNAVKSKIGLLITFLVEMLLSLLSSATLTSYFSKGVDFYQIPLQFLPFVVIVVGIENMLRLVHTMVKTPAEIPVGYRLSKTLNECGITSSLIVLTDLLILAFIYPFLVSNTKKFCVFASLALIIDHFLHLTFFSAVLSIDIKRSGLYDLLNDESKSSSNKFCALASIFGFGNGSDNYDLSASTDNQNKTNRTIRRFFSKLRSPFSSTFTGSLAIILFLIGTNIRWTTDSLSVPLVSNSQNALPPTPIISATRESAYQTHLKKSYLKAENDLLAFLDKKSFSDEIFQLLHHRDNYDSQYGDSTPSKVLITVYNQLIAVKAENITNKLIEFSFNLNLTYKFDIYYVLEFLTSLVFVLSWALMIFRYFTSNLPVDSDDDKPRNQNLEKEHSFQVKVLSGGHLLDIIKIKTSKSPFIVSVGLDHKLLVWSPISQPIPAPTQIPITQEMWPITHVVLSDHGNFVAIFSRTGAIKCWSRVSMSWIWKVEIQDLVKDIPLEAFFRRKTIPAFVQRKMKTLQDDRRNLNPSSRRNSMRSITSPSLGPTFAFGNTSGLSNELEELVFILKSGEAVIVSCQDGSVKREKISSSPLVSSVKLITPRVNDRLISTTFDGKLIVSTAVNNKWKTRVVEVDYKRFNNPETDDSGVDEIKRIQATFPPYATKIGRNVVQYDAETHKIEEFSKSVITVVPFVGMIVRTRGLFAELIDVSTGILIKRFAICPFKKPTFRVFHDQPTHCRFCGSASISSFSVVYSSSEINKVKMHTFNVDHKVKTSICLRVERDPREIRCVGFDSVSEYQYELDDIEGWCDTDKNQIIGVKKKSEEKIHEAMSEFENSTLRKRGFKNNNNENKHLNESAPNLWEGWTMAADGKIDFYEIPETGNSDGLLVNSIGEITRFGYKSIVVGFGNIMKVLYLGNDDLIYNETDQNINEEISGLTFVNKRRKHFKRSALSESLNFSEVDAIPGISELSL